MHQQFCFSWKNVSVEASEKKQSFWKSVTRKRVILNNVSGLVHSNSLVAIMGASGSGKTTILGALSGRIKDRSGVLKINHHEISNDNIKDMSGYVHQENIFTDTLTVMEYLIFMAALQLRHVAEVDQHATIKRILLELSLESHRKTMIRNLSGGERRRLSLAGALLDDPRIIFCDEPTTGLDSFSAITVVQKLRSISATGRIVLSTIHQPSSELFSYFTDIALLANGNLVFNGSKNEAKSFFESLNLRCPLAYNPAEFYIKCITVSENGDAREVLQIANTFKKWKQPCSIDHTCFSVTQKKTINTDFFYQLQWLLWRCLIVMRRNIFIRFLGFVCLLGSALFLALSYAFVKLTDPDSVQNIQGIIMYVTSEAIFTNMYEVIYVFPGEVQVFLKEQSLYSPLPYFLSKLVVLAPLCLLSSASVITIVFIFENFFHGFEMYFSMIYVLFCANMTSAAIGLSFSATFSSLESVELFLTPVEMIMMIMSGMWIKINQLPLIFRWLKYLSPFYYCFQSMSIIFWRNVPVLSNCSNNGTATTCYGSGDDVLESYGFLKNYDIVPYNILFLHIISAVYCLIGFVGILRKKKLFNVY